MKRKRWQKAVLSTFLVLGALVATGITSTIGWRPIIGPKARTLTDRRFEPSPARLARGEYIVRNVAGCLFCHSDLDTSQEGGGDRSPEDRRPPPLATRSRELPGLLETLIAATSISRAALRLTR